MEKATPFGKKVQFFSYFFVAVGEKGNILCFAGKIQLSNIKNHTIMKKRWSRKKSL